MAGTKTALQEKKFINIPPTAGPVMPPSAMMPPRIPNALPRFLFLKIDATIAVEFDSKIDAPIASIQRNPIKNGKLMAVVFRKEPNAKNIKPRVKSFFFEKLSQSLPNKGNNIVNTNIYAVITHWTSSSFAEKLSEILYNATLTVEESSMPKKLPVAIIENIVH